VHVSHLGTLQPGPDLKKGRETVGGKPPYLTKINDTFVIYFFLLKKERRKEGRKK
jgi:hypothetical protein